MLLYCHSVCLLVRSMRMVISYLLRTSWEYFTYQITRIQDLEYYWVTFLYSRILMMWMWRVLIWYLLGWTPLDTQNFIWSVEIIIYYIIIVTYWVFYFGICIGDIPSFCRAPASPMHRRSEGRCMCGITPQQQLCHSSNICSSLWSFSCLHYCVWVSHN